ncbi:MAG: exo-alpha-sialidase, partial [Candidatus Krumholzibacteria bacterium]|nr:exo-alpha-sialidase [Candidatus Krumholzibacteria bacterium]
CHRLRLFPSLRHPYLAFTATEPLRLGNHELASVGFGKQVEQFFEGEGLRVNVAGQPWKSLFVSRGGAIYGRLSADDRDLYRSDDRGDTSTLLARFDEPIKSVFVSETGTILVGVKGAVYRSSDGGRGFQRSLELSTPESFIRHNNGMTEAPGHRLLVGEYGNVWSDAGWQAIAYLYLSTDEGETWETSDFLIEKGANKHVHMVRYSRILNRLLMTDGDNKKRLWISDPVDRASPNPEWNLVTRFHLQMGGYTTAAECDGKVLLGTDYQGGTNFVVETKNGLDFVKKVIPDPYRRSPIDNMVVRRSADGSEIWANLPYSTSRSRCLLMFTKDAGATWTRVFEYNRSAYTVWLHSSSLDGTDDLFFSIEEHPTGERSVYRVCDPD